MGPKGRKSKVTKKVSVDITQPAGTSQALGNSYKNTNVIDDFIKKNQGKPKIVTSDNGQFVIHLGDITFNLKEFLTKSGKLFANNYQAGTLVSIVREDLMAAFELWISIFEENDKNVNDVLSQQLDEITELLISTATATQQMVKGIRNAICKKKPTATEERVKNVLEKVNFVYPCIEKYMETVLKSLKAVGDLTSELDCLNMNSFSCEMSLKLHLRKFSQGKNACLIIPAERKIIYENLAELECRSKNLGKYSDLAREGSLILRLLRTYCDKMEKPSRSYLKRAIKELQIEITCLSETRINVND